MSGPDIMYDSDFPEVMVDFVIPEIHFFMTRLGSSEHTSIRRRPLCIVGFVLF